MPKLCSVCGVTYSDALVFCPADGTTLRSADLKEDLVGSVIADRYLVTDILGEGGMGTVYLARHVRLPQQAAIKVLRKEMLQDPSAIARFNREAANASKIDHDRVARVYDFGETGQGVVYLAMEYVPGKTLKALLAEGGPMAPLRAANVVRQIAEGLDAAHRMAIVHRDLKPDNVMVIRDGDAPDAEERVKVVDFGIAKALGAHDAHLTKTGYVLGTPDFMSPEQLLGETLDVRSDVYALAIVAYQCLTGDLPFASDTPEHGLVERLTTPARPLALSRPTVPWPDAVQQVFDRALARDPALRPESAGAFAHTLADALGASAASAPATQRRARPRRLMPSVGVALAAALLALGAHRLTRPPVRAAVRPPPAPMDARRDGAARAPTAEHATPPTRRPATPRVVTRAAPPPVRSPARADTPRRTLDSVKASLYEEAADSAAARAAVGVLHALLPRLTTPDDSSWAFASLARAHVMLGDEVSACAALRAASTLAAMAGARSYVQTLSRELACRGTA